MARSRRARAKHGFVIREAPLSIDATHFADTPRLRVGLCASAGAALTFVGAPIFLLTGWLSEWAYLLTCAFSLSAYALVLGHFRTGAPHRRRKTPFLLDGPLKDRTN